MKQLLVIMALALVFVAKADAQEKKSPNAQQAERMFRKAYNMIYGPEGASFSYKISILKIYSSEGTGWYKGNKSKSISKRSIIWDNGDIKYILRRGKGIVEIHDPKVNKKDKLLQKFKFDPDDFTYSIAEDEGKNLLVTLRAKEGAKGSMKEIRALLDRKTQKPISLKIKVSFFWANITFSNFQAGGIDDSMFVFPRADYPDYQIVDER